MRLASVLFAMRNKISILLRGYGKRAIPAIYFVKEIKMANKKNEKKMSGIIEIIEDGEKAFSERKL